MASEADGEAKARRGPSRYGAIPLLLEGPDRESSVSDLVLSEAREVSGPSWVFPGASGGQLGGLRCRPELAGALSRTGGGFGSEMGLSGLTQSQFVPGVR